MGADDPAVEGAAPGDHSREQQGWQEGDGTCSDHQVYRLDGDCCAAFVAAARCAR